ncbi:hypothetical protein M569_01622 [Genlisea aurea]|uniref:Replication protein A C-terminal domain-containing protein n=1 Tax=Genlisea aurea TaxID=192259 RepID=S8D6R0_9LAMI|nr:hypothetical protein M569_01622 [Genlisea aurea]
MYGNSQFDGNAAFSGGGFMPSQTTQPTTDSPFSVSKNRDSQVLLPLTVKQISEAFQASDDKTNFIIDGVDVNNVKLVGILQAKMERITDVSFVLDDGTGRIDCHRWVNEAIDSKEMEQLVNGMYIKVHGHLKGFQGRKQLMVYSVRRVTDYNEVAYHFSECIYVHCHNTRLRRRSTDFIVPSQDFAPAAATTPSKGYQQQTPWNNASSSIKGVDELVLNYLQQPRSLMSEKGVHRHELSQKLNLPEHKILEAIESLESEGLIYSTIDEFHYKSTANG